MVIVRWAPSHTPQHWRLFDSKKFIRDQQVCVLLKRITVENSNVLYTPNASTNGVCLFVWLCLYVQISRKTQKAVA